MWTIEGRGFPSFLPSCFHFKPSKISPSSSSNSDDSTSSSSDEDILEDMDQNDLVIFQLMATMASNTNDLFNSHEMEEGKGQYINSTVGVRDVLSMI
jgi:hypothetical protein